MLMPAVGRAVTLTARGFPDASTQQDRAAWMVTAGKPPRGAAHSHIARIQNEREFMRDPL
jgi:hypothetical protein